MRRPARLKESPASRGPGPTATFVSSSKECSRPCIALSIPRDAEQPIALRGLSWIVNPYEEGGVVIAIEIGMGAAIAGPFQIDKSALETMIGRVIAPPVAQGRVH